MGEREYDGGPLAENEFLLKVFTFKRARIDNEDFLRSGFLTKLTQKGDVPVKFKEWKKYFDPIPITIHTEIPRSGWKIIGFRGGESQNWAVVLHPLGFTVEIYMKHLIDLLQEVTAIDGFIQAELTWEYAKLIRH